eukprot:1121532-Pleurochrysis_carterae.AAC.2
MQYLVNLHSSHKPGTSSAVCYNAETVTAKRQFILLNFLRIEVSTCRETSPLVIVSRARERRKGPGSIAQGALANTRAAP